MTRSLTELSAGALAKGIALGDFSARQVLEAHLARHYAVHDRVNAVITLDLDRARAEADAVDASRARGEALGPLAGVPMTIKDGFDVAGMPATAGNPALRNRPKTCADAILVQRVRLAGAIIWGKTNVPYMLGDFQTTNEIFGTTNNPFDLARTPGGSSGGAAAALACGITPLEIGSDIGGSLRTPSNFCGVAALKPSHGWLPQAGHVPPLPGMDPEVDLNVVGPMARSCADLRLLLEVLSQTSAPKPKEGALTLALWTGEAGFPLSREVQGAVLRAGQAARDLGHHVVPFALPFAAKDLIASYVRILIDIIAQSDTQMAALRQSLKGVAPLARLIGMVDRRIWSRWAVASAITASFAELEAALRHRAAMIQAMASLFTHVDAILAPIGPVEAFPHDHRPILDRRLAVDGEFWLYTSALSWIALASALHVPALSLPAGRTQRGLPVGVQVIGAKAQDFALLDLGEQLETKLGGFSPPSI